MQVVHTRDSLVTWSAGIHSIRLGPQVYNSFVGEFPTSHGDMVDDEQSFPSPNRRSVGEDHLEAREHATSICPRS